MPLAHTEKNRHKADLALFTEFSTNRNAAMRKLLKPPIYHSLLTIEVRLSARHTGTLLPLALGKALNEIGFGARMLFITEEPICVCSLKVS